MQIILEKSSLFECKSKTLVVQLGTVVFRKVRMYLRADDTKCFVYNAKVTAAVETTKR